MIVAAPSLSLPPGLQSIHHKTPIPYTNYRRNHRKRSTSSSTRRIFKQTQIRTPNIPANSQYYHQHIDDRQEGSLCFLFHNSGGLPIKNHTAMRNIFAAVRKHTVSFLALQETSLNLNHPTCTRLVKQAFQDHHSGRRQQAHRMLAVRTRRNPRTDERRLRGRTSPR